MPKKLVDLKCSNEECGRTYIDQWYTSEDIEAVNAGKIVCDECHNPLVILLGRPQFSIKGPGVYDPGKH